MSDAIVDNLSETTEEITEEKTYPQPDKAYVKRSRCIYCGSKKIQRLWGYDWCDKPCSMGRLALDIYERKNFLGKYSKHTTNITEEDDMI